LYEARKPQDAIINRGIWNWAVPGGLVFFGFLMIWGAVSSQCGILSRRRRAV